MNAPWLYDETIQTGTDYRDEAEVRAYDEHMQKLRDVVQEAEEIRGAVALAADATVWEIGTGTGECALYLSRFCTKVIATDVSPVMLAYARRKAAEQQITNVAFEIGGFLSGHAPEDPVDVVVSQLALHHLPDFWKARGLSRIAGNLRPGGKLFLRDVVYKPEAVRNDDFFRQAVNAVRDKAGENGAQRTIDHIRKEYSTFDWVLEGMLQRSDLRILRKEMEGFLTSYVCEK